MIGCLAGNIIELHPQLLLLDVGGVGYEVEIPLSAFYLLGDAEGTVTIHTHLVVRDDAHLLYGFMSRDERELFRALIKVNGVGPRMAITILSGLDAESFAASVLKNDVKALTGLPGVGKKTAERLIMEMRDKVESFAPAGGDITGKIPANVEGDAVSALIGLGYKHKEAAQAVSLVESPGEDVETLIRLALKQLMQG